MGSSARRVVSSRSLSVSLHKCRPLVPVTQENGLLQTLTALLKHNSSLSLLEWLRCKWKGELTATNVHMYDSTEKTVAL